MSQNRLFKLIAFVVAVLAILVFVVHEFIRNNINTVEMGGVLIHYTAAITNEEKEVGLSETSVLAENEGMLFFFNYERPTFWMKNMSIPIDIIWIDKNRIIQIDENVAPPEGPDSELQTYYPPSPIDYVLEVNAGFAETNNIDVGDEVRIN